MFLYLTVFGITNDSPVLLLEANSKYLLNIQAIDGALDIRLECPVSNELVLCDLK